MSLARTGSKLEAQIFGPALPLQKTKNSCWIVVKMERQSEGDFNFLFHFRWEKFGGKKICCQIFFRLPDFDSNSGFDFDLFLFLRKTFQITILIFYVVAKIAKSCILSVVGETSNVVLTELLMKRWYWNIFIDWSKNPGLDEILLLTRVNPKIDKIPP